jgi:hypothetical protein
MVEENAIITCQHVCLRVCSLFDGFSSVARYLIAKQQ